MKSRTLLKTELTFNEEELQAFAKAADALDSLLSEVEDTGADEVIVHRDFGDETYYFKQTLDEALEVLDTLRYTEDVCMENNYDEEK
jgi:cysteinyl-tRNA synthetase